MTPSSELRPVPRPGIAHCLALTVLVAVGFAFRRNTVIGRIGAQWLEWVDHMGLGLLIGLSLASLVGLVVWNLQRIGWPREPGEWLWLIAGVEVAWMMASVGLRMGQPLTEFLLAIALAWLYGTMVAWPGMPRRWQAYAVLGVFVAGCIAVARVLPRDEEVRFFVAALTTAQAWSLVALVGLAGWNRLDRHRWTHWLGLLIATYGKLYFLAYLPYGQAFFLPLHQN